jgi:hypothetical protein
MKNIHILPTDKPSRLFLNNVNKKLLIDNDGTLKKVLPSGLYYNIYITSDIEIKEGDWCIDEKENVVKADKNFIFNCSHEFDEFWRKIILTTDQELIKDGVQAIDDEFLEWFVKNPSCEEIKVVYDKDAFPYGVETAKGYGWYKIIIPQEEPKQEIRKNRLLEELIEDIKNQQSFLKSIRKNPQLYYYKFGNCIYERLYNNNNCFEMQDPYGGQSSKMEQELINLKAEKIYYE